MQRITISIDDDSLETIDHLVAKRGYTSRSEALRDIVREAQLQDQAASGSTGPCIAALSYVYEHETRELARRLTSAQHHHHDLSVSTLHIHVDERDCLEIAVLKGTVQDVRAFADSITSQRGVRHGNLHLVPVVGGPSRDHLHVHAGKSKAVSK